MAASTKRSPPTTSSSAVFSGQEKHFPFLPGPEPGGIGMLLLESPWSAVQPPGSRTYIWKKPVAQDAQNSPVYPVVQSPAPRQASVGTQVWHSATPAPRAG